MDQFTAHLDRGWDLAQRGDALGAEASAKRALELETDSPEAHNLLGFSCALRGEHEEALGYYQQAIALDDTFLEAVLNAAELCVHPLGELDTALRLCQDALSLVESDEELTDALLLQFDALLGLGQLPEALKTCERIPDPPYANPLHYFLVGRALFECGRFDEAERQLVEASRKDPENPEAWYYLGLLRDEQGDAKRATSAFLKSLELDSQLPPLPWALSREAFYETAETALEKLTPRLRAFVDEQELYVAEMPGVETVVEGADPRTPILLDALEGGASALRIFVYQRNIERICGSVDRVVETIVASLEREIASAVFGDVDAPAAENAILN